jgi:hypothetical protein
MASDSQTLHLKETLARVKTILNILEIPERKFVNNGYDFLNITAIEILERVRLIENALGVPQDHINNNGYDTLSVKLIEILERVKRTERVLGIEERVIPNNAYDMISKRIVEILARVKTIESAVAMQDGGGNEGYHLYVSDRSQDHMAEWRSMSASKKREWNNLARLIKH